MTNVFCKRRKSGHKHIQREDDVKPQRQGGHLQAKEKGLEWFPPSEPSKKPNVQML